MPDVILRPSLHPIGTGVAPTLNGNDQYTKLLIHCDGADASTAFTDVSAAGRTVTTNGDAQVDTAQSKFGGASALFDGTGDFLSVADHADFEFGTGDFTIDFWMRPANTTASFYEVFGKRANTSSYGPYVIAQGGTSLVLFMSSSGASWDIASSVSMGTVAANTWYHVALVRSGSNIYRFLDGALIGTTSSSASLLDNAVDVRIGSSGGGTGGYPGHVDEIRVSKGIARWTAAFSVPTFAYG